MSEHTLAGWSRVNLTDLATYINGYAFKPEDWSEHGLPIVRIAQITGSSADCDYYRGRVSGDFKINHGDIVFSWSGTLSRDIHRAGLKMKMAAGILLINQKVRPRT